MSRTKPALHAAACAALVLVLSVSPAVPGEPAPPELPTVESVAEGNAAFALDLYGRLAASKPGENIFFSPHSISSALAMTYAGARGATAAEMSDVLRFPEEQAGLHQAMARLDSVLLSRASLDVIELSFANALWGQDGYPFLEPFLETTRAHYGAGLRTVDFARDPEPARLAINDWAETETRGRIKDLLGRSDVTTATRLVLTNAVYFKGDWAQQFDEKNTREGDFHVAPGVTVRAPLMRRSGSYRWTEHEGAIAFELPYEGGDLGMVIVAPPTVERFGEVEALMQPAHVAAIMKGIDSSEPVKAVVVVPKFELRLGAELSDLLSEMGMPSAFAAGSADFSGMSEKRDLFLSRVIHKAFVAVDEKGTEAAAATAVVMKLAVSRPLELRADVPFVFFIRDSATGAILFMGRIADPTA